MKPWSAEAQERAWLKKLDTCAYTHMMPIMKTIHGVDLCHCFAARRHARLLTRLYDRHLAPSRLTISQFSILAMLEARPHILIAELADAMVMERTTLVRALKPLQIEGYVSSQVEGPRSTLRLSLSAGGMAKIREAEAYWQAAQREEESHVSAATATAIRSSLIGRIAST